MIIGLSKKNLYKICLIIWIVFSIFWGRTTIDEVVGDVAITIYSLGRAITYVLLFCIVLWNGLTKKETATIIIISVILLLSAVSSSEMVLFGVMLFVIASPKINPDELLAVYFKTHLFILMVTILLAWTHIIDTNIMSRGLIQRNSFGFSHPNSFGGEVITVVICYVTRRWKKMKNYELIAIVGLGYCFLQAANCRMASLVLVIYTICFLIIKNIYKYKVNVVFIKNVVVLMFLTIVLLTVYMTFFYSYQNKILQIIDGIFSYRFSVMNAVYRVQGIKLFGQKIIDDTLVGIDNSYARVLLIGGVIPFLILVTFSWKLCNEFAKKNEVKYLLAFATIVLSGFIENNFFRVENNFCFIIGGAYLLSSYYEQRRKKYHGKNIVRERI